MQKILYHDANALSNFDLKKFQQSLNRYAKIPEAAITKALDSLSVFPKLHVSRLAETGAILINQFAGKEQAQAYLNDHQSSFEVYNFERLRRITGYLVGTLERWNDGKRAEEAARVKHSIDKTNFNSSLKDSERVHILQTQALNRNIAYQQ